MPKIDKTAGLQEFLPPAEPPPQGAELTATEVEADLQAALSRAPAKATPRAGGAGSLFHQISEEDERLRLLLYGREGSRKTTSALVATQYGPVMVINAEGGLKPRALAKHGVKVENLMVWPDPAGDGEITFEGLMAVVDELRLWISDAPDEVFAVVVDSASAVFERLRQNATAKRQVKQLKKADDPSLIDTDYVDRDDYGVATNQFALFTQALHRLPVHLVFTALERFDEKENFTVPHISPAARNNLLGLVDMALYLRVTARADEDDETFDTSCRALTREGKSTRGKDRFDALPRVLVDPTFERVLGYKNGQIVEADDPAQTRYHELQAAKTAAETKPAGKRPTRSRAAVTKKTEASTDAETPKGA